MNTKHAVIASVDEYLRVASLSPSALGMSVANDSKLIPRLRAGSVTLNMVSRIETYIAANPPKVGARASDNH